MIMTKFPVQGGCHCGSVRYTLLAPALSVQHCHCSRCRKLYGQLVSQGAVVDRSDIEIAGTANLVKYRTSPTFEEHFCKTCGCHLFAYEDSEPRLMYFFPSTLDGGVHPGHPAGTESHIYVGSKAEWDTICGNLPQYDTMSPDQIIIGKQRAAGEG
jgi:hypothetical protein